MVVFVASAARQFKKFPPDIRERINAKVAEIAADPHGVAEGVYRKGGCLKSRMGTHRILYEADDKTRTVSILKIADRREIYSKKHRP